MTIERVNALRERRAYARARSRAAFERFEAQYPDWFMGNNDDYVRECVDWRKYFRWYKLSLSIDGQIDEALDELLKQVTI